MECPTPSLEASINTGSDDDPIPKPRKCHDCAASVLGSSRHTLLSLLVVLCNSSHAMVCATVTGNDIESGVAASFSQIPALSVVTKRISYKLPVTG
jgi:hypothetical protein